MRDTFVVPEHHGELGLWPPLSEWSDVLARNRDILGTWDFTIGGMGFQELRNLARRELLQGGAEYSASLGISTAHRDPDEPIIITGHQPELFHPGVWVKHLAMQRVADRIGASAIDTVVDSDAFAALEVGVPVLGPPVRRSTAVLAVGAEHTCFACAPAPSAERVEEFCSAVEADLSDHDEATRDNARRFFGNLRESAQVSSDLASAVTGARRRYEAALGTDYLAYPVTGLSRSRAFLHFAVGIMFDAARFAEAVNASLIAHRALNGIRSAAQPFANLSEEGGALEVPFWVLSEGMRETLHVQRDAGGLQLRTATDDIVRLPEDPVAAVEALLASGVTIAPKAVTLTLFTRSFVADLFIHGIGGARYDEVTDAVCRAYFEVEPVPYVVATMTMLLPAATGVQPVDDDISALKERLNRLAHNPDQVLGAADLDDATRGSVMLLVAEKTELVARIARPDEDKKTVGAAIRELNARIAEVLDPLREQWESELAGLETRRAEASVLRARDYPFFLWTPQDIDRVLESELP